MSRYTFKYTMSEEDSYKMGRELFELWMNLGSMRKMGMEWNRRHPEIAVEVISYNTLLRRSKAWWVHNVADGNAIVKKYKPNVPDLMVETKLMQYVTTMIRGQKSFLIWLEEDPWAKKYEEFYKPIYDL